MTISNTTGGFWADPDENTVVVATGELAVVVHPQVLVTPALGSCVGVTLWDAFARRGGMAHIMLPSPSDTRLGGLADRFATVAIPRLAEAVTGGLPRRRLVAKLAGGSTMFGGEANITGIGMRNVDAVKQQLSLLRIPVVAEDIGGNYARTMELYLDTGLVVVRSYRYGIKEL
ncbi:MAG TPA: chemotaxis protein CheD [Actinobacteria bacterium]|nr:chemotaxis protein CheD [Actinomycetota bacterium]